jgi:hypothetical protein
MQLRASNGRICIAGTAANVFGDFFMAAFMPHNMMVAEESWRGDTY